MSKIVELEKKNPGNSGLIMTQARLHEIMDQKIYAAVDFASKASIYRPDITAIELTTAQTIVVSLMHSLLNSDMGFCINLLEIAASVDHLRSTYLPTWLKDDFNFLDRQVIQIISTAALLTQSGMIIIPCHILKILVALAPKYRVAECCKASGNTDVLDFLENFEVSVSSVNNSTYDDVKNNTDELLELCPKYRMLATPGDYYELPRLEGHRVPFPTEKLILRGLGFNIVDRPLNSVERIEKPCQDGQEVWIEVPDRSTLSSTTPVHSPFTPVASTPSSTFAEDASAVSPYLLKVQEYLNLPEDFKEEEVLSLLNYSDEEGNTPLHCAIKEKDPYLVESMLELGAKVNAADAYGHSAAHVAAGQGSVPMLQILAKHHANLSQARHDGCTPLHQAIINGQVFAAKWLLENGCDINSRNNDGLTPLHLAAQWDQLEIVRFLLANGADVDVYSNNGKTPLDVATEEENRSIVQLLSSKRES